MAEALKKQQIEKYYQSISWHSLFAGMGIFPDVGEAHTEVAAEQAQRVRQLQQSLVRCAQNFKPHGEYLRETHGPAPA